MSKWYKSALVKGTLIFFSVLSAITALLSLVIISTYSVSVKEIWNKKPTEYTDSKEFENQMINSRFAGIVSFILFFVINGIVEYIYNLFAKYGLMGIHSGLYIGIGECAFYIVACIILFVISSVLAEKKLSV